MSLLLENARVQTLDPLHPRARALAIVGDRIAAVGDRADARRAAGSRARAIDCGGATVLPGLIDPHLHLHALASRHAHLDCGAHGRVEDLLAAIADRARGQPRGTWIRADGLDEVRLGRLPTAAELDRAAPHWPVRLRHRSRHASVLNRCGLRLLGDATTSGLVAGREAAVSRVVGRLPAATLADGLAAAARELLACGLTTVAEATPHTWATLGPLRAAMRRGAVPLRVFAMRPPRGRTWRADGRLRPGPVKILVEETPAGLEPSPAALGRIIARAAADGAQVAVHCVGAGTLVAALAGFAALPRRQRARRHRLEHVAECPPPLVARIAALGLTVVTNPIFVRERGDVYRTESPDETWAWLYRARSLARAGIALAGASDAPVASPSPWLGMAAARTRRTAAGAVLGEGERLSARAALALWTRGAAYALHADALGRLRRGGPADAIVVEPDPLRASPDEVAATRVRLVVVGGEVVWEA